MSSVLPIALAVLDLPSPLCEQQQAAGGVTATANGTLRSAVPPARALLACAVPAVCDCPTIPGRRTAATACAAAVHTHQQLQDAKAAAVSVNSLPRMITTGLARSAWLGFLSFAGCLTSCSLVAAAAGSGTLARRIGRRPCCRNRTLISHQVRQLQRMKEAKSFQWGKRKYRLSTSLVSPQSQFASTSDSPKMAPPCNAKQIL